MELGGVQVGDPGARRGGRSRQARSSRYGRQVMAPLPSSRHPNALLRLFSIPTHCLFPLPPPPPLQEVWLAHRDHLVPHGLPLPPCRKYGWNYDEINAGSRTAITWFHMGLTVVDSLDTLLILGLEEEFIEARQWVANHLDFEQQTPVSVGEAGTFTRGGGGRKLRIGDGDVARCSFLAAHHAHRLLRRRSGSLAASSQPSTTATATSSSFARRSSLGRGSCSLG